MHSLFVGAVPEQTGVVQSTPDHPDGHVQVSGAVQVPPFSHTCWHDAVIVLILWLPWSTMYILLEAVSEVPRKMFRCAGF